MDTRELVYNKVPGLLANKNISDLGLDDLAQTTGINDRIYQEFTDINQVVNFIIERELSQKLKLGQELIEMEGSLQKKLIHLLDYHFQYIQQHPEIANIIIEKSTLPRKDAPEAISDFQNKFPALLSQVIENAIQKGEIREVDPRLIASAIFHSIHGVTLKVKYDANYNYPQAKRELINLICIGINN